MSTLTDDGMDNSDLGNERYKDIVLKAKEARNTKDRLLNNSQDRSCSILVKRHKKKLGLSQSFVMRQASALSRKNKELVNALLISKHQIQVYENSMRSLQSTQMALRMKLNSREVDLHRLTEKFQIMKDERDRFLNVFYQVQDLFAGASLPSHDKPIDFDDQITFSAQPRKAKSASLIQGEKPEKWNPDLTMIQEKSVVVREEMEVSQMSSFNEQQSPQSASNSPPPSEVSHRVDCDEEISPECNFQYRRKSRRQSALFVASDFVTQPENQTPDRATNETETIPPSYDNAVQESRQGLDGHAAVTDSILNQLSMDFTDPCESMIEVGDKSMQSKTTDTGMLSKEKTQSKSTEKPTKPVKKVRIDLSSTAGKKTVRKGRPKKSHNLLKDLNSDDFFNCSDDSFLTNPEKKIVLASKQNDVKDRSNQRSSLGLSDITNSCNQGSRPLRRSAPVCYREPSLNSKLRRGDKTSDNTLYATKSPKHRKKH